MCCALLILDVCLSRCFLFDGGVMVNFGGNSSIVLAFFAPGNDVNDVSSSLKMDVSL
jgi:hypothetical protein